MARNDQVTRGDRTGSHAALGDEGGGKKKGLGWLPLALLAAALIGLVAFLVARNVGDAGDDPGVDVSDERNTTGTADPTGLDANAEDGADSGSEPDDTSADATAGTQAAGGGTTATTAARTASTAASGASGAAAGSGGAASGASGAATSPLVSGSTALLPLPAGGLAAYANQPAQATSVNVQSVVSDEGFWVGDSEANRVFVRLIQQGESPVQIEAGRKVSFTGTVKPNTPAIAEGVEAAEGLAQFQQQGFHVETTAVQQG